MGALKTRPKGIAVHTIVLIIMMGFFAVAALYILGIWAINTGSQADRTTCAWKKIDYCTDWKGNSYDEGPWDWQSRDPKGCEDLSPPILKPFTIAECEIVLES